jgi:hypothetical protein
VKLKFSDFLDTFILTPQSLTIAVVCPQSQSNYAIAYTESSLKTKITAKKDENVQELSINGFNTSIPTCSTIDQFKL